MKAVKGFGDRFSEVVAERGRLCVGIDSHLGPLDARQLPYSVDGLERFAAACVEALGDIIVVVKPQVAFFEACGSKGSIVLERASTDLRDAGALSIADTKRGDIGPTMAACVEVWLSDGSPLAADVLTVSPYLGLGVLDLAASLALESGCGLLVLVATSNSRGVSVQKAMVSGESLAQIMVNETAAINARQIAAGVKAGSIDVAVGVMLDDAPALSDLCGPILMPGVGAQGGVPADVDRLTGELRGLALPNVSRATLPAGPDSAALWRATFEAAAPFFNES